MTLICAGTDAAATLELIIARSSASVANRGDGYGGKVRGICVRLTGTRFTTITSFRLRYRVIVT